MDEFKFFTTQSLHSGRRVITRLSTIINLPKSILDVGCGVGGWSLAFKEAGAEKFILLDHPSNRKENLLFSENEFYTCDMNVNLPPVYPVDLVLCFEVLEHLKPKRTGAVIEYLTQCSDTILFSAAIPGQAGLGHINENYSVHWESYFKQFGFTKYDIIRQLIIEDGEIEYFIRQNAFLYVKGQGLLKTTDHKNFIPDDFELINRKVLNRHKSPIDLIKMMPKSFKKTMKHRFGKKK